MAVVCYFVLSHVNVPQVVRLVRRLRAGSPDCRVLIHHDATAEPFDLAAIAEDPHVHLMRRWIHGEWAAFSLVEIVSNGVDVLRARGVAYDWLVLLSGQDYPIRPLAEFEAALASSGDGMIAIDPAPGGLLDRYRFAWHRAPRAIECGALHRIVGLLTRLNHRQPWLRFQSGRVGCRIGVLPRRSPLAAGESFAKGTQWWALSARALDYAREFARARPEFVRHYAERTIMPDESYFQTIVTNAGSLLRLERRDGRFTRWATPNAASPETLLTADLPAMRASGAYFARKFDARSDSAVLDALDRLDA